MQPGMEEMEVGEWVGEQVGVGILGLQVKLRYEELVVEENQRQSLLMGWAGLRQELERSSCLTAEGVNVRLCTLQI